MEYNLLSILLGLLAWALGITAIVKKGCPWCIFTSMTLCGASLVSQFYEIDRRVQLHDWSALLDTSDTLAPVARFLLITTAFLNLIALLRRNKAS